MPGLSVPLHRQKKGAGHPLPPMQFLTIALRQKNNRVNRMNRIKLRQLDKINDGNDKKSSALQLSSLFMFHRSYRYIVFIVD